MIEHRRRELLADLLAPTPWAGEGRRWDDFRGVYCLKMDGGGGGGAGILESRKQDLDVLSPTFIFQVNVMIFMCYYS